LSRHVDLHVPAEELLSQHDAGANSTAPLVMCWPAGGRHPFARRPPRSWQGHRDVAAGTLLARTATMRLLHDRGTLRFEGSWPRHRVSELPGVLWDPRSEVFRAPPWRYADVVKELGRQGFAFDDGVVVPRAPLDAFAEVALRPYQQAALCAWDAADRRGIAVLPTGAGKTRLAIAAMAAARVPTLCLVPTRVLLHQWRAELGRYYPGRVGCWGDGQRERAPVTVMTHESAYRYMADVGTAYDLLIVDEVHHFGGGSRDEALEMSAARLRLGLTATMPSDGPAHDRLVGLVGPVVVELRVDDLAGVYLADFDVVELRLSLDPEERRRYQAEAAAFRHYYNAFRRVQPWGSWTDFAIACQQSREGQRAYAAWRRARRIAAFTRNKARALQTLLERHRDARTLIFTADNDAAYAIARAELVMPLTCDIKRKERDVALDDFRRGALRALVSSRVLNEGIDVPDAGVAIIVGGSHGEREHVQRIGRLLRPTPGKRAVVYELVSAGTSEVRQAERRRRGLGRPNPPSP
jgi:superfamily II DNA or RNA helicase